MTISQKLWTLIIEKRSHGLYWFTLLLCLPRPPFPFLFRDISPPLLVFGSRWATNKSTPPHTFFPESGHIKSFSVCFSFFEWNQRNFFFSFLVDSQRYGSRAAWSPFPALLRKPLSASQGEREAQRLGVGGKGREIQFRPGSTCH